DELSVKTDLIRKFYFKPEFGHRLPVDGHITRGNINIRIPARTDPRIGYIFVQPHFIRVFRHGLLAYRRIASGITFLTLSSLSSGYLSSPVLVCSAHVLFFGKDRIFVPNSVIRYL